MSSSSLSQKLAKFKQNFSQILGPKRHGYNTVGLDQPLVSSHAQSDDDYFREHGVQRPGSQQPAGYGQYQVPHHAAGTGAYADDAGGLSYTSGTANAIPDEVESVLLAKRELAQAVKQELYSSRVHKPRLGASALAVDFAIGFYVYSSSLYRRFTFFKIDKPTASRSVLRHHLQDLFSVCMSVFCMQGVNVIHLVLCRGMSCVVWLG